MTTSGVPNTPAKRPPTAVKVPPVTTTASLGSTTDASCRPISTSSKLI